MKRASYQSGWIWSLCEKEVILPDPCLWGWKVEKEELIPKWQEIQSDINVHSLIKTCSCSSAKCKTCFCSRNNYPCIPFCGCKRKCANGTWTTMYLTIRLIIKNSILIFCEINSLIGKRKVSGLNHLFTGVISFEIWLWSLH